MKAYIRLSRKNKYKVRYQIISGTPETHKENTVLAEWNTRRQAMRKAKDMGYELVVRGRAPDGKAA
jgi:hypothetical protein